MRRKPTRLALAAAALLAGGLVVLAPGRAAAQQLLDSYSAWLSPRDHFNSRGQRLTSAAAIIRQDRANLHRFGRADPQDQWDGFVHDEGNRAVLERWIAAGELSPNDARAIVGGNSMVSSYIKNEKLREAFSFHSLLVGGNPMITVEIWGSGGTGRSVRVWVQR